jgi:hypothetical protein
MRHKRDRRSAHISHSQRLALVSHFKQIRERSGSVAGHGYDADGRVTHRHSHPVIAHHIALWFATGVGGGLVDRVPVLGAVNEVDARDFVL